MSLQFIMGNSGSGKSYCLYDTVVREAIENPDKNYLVIVPEQFTMQTQKDLCLAHPKGGCLICTAWQYACGAWQFHWRQQELIISIGQLW